MAALKAIIFSSCFVISYYYCFLAGKGCFKCGSLDHIAKDCTGSDDAKQPPKYILKDDDFSGRGGNDNSRLVNSYKTIHAYRGGKMGGSSNGSNPHF